MGGVAAGGRGNGGVEVWDGWGWSGRWRLGLVGMGGVGEGGSSGEGGREVEVGTGWDGRCR